MYRGFVKFQHIERFGDKNFLTNGINQGVCYLFPKIDGENCCIWREDNAIKYGKRKVEVFTDKDSGGLISAVNRVPAFRMYLERHPDHRLYGELMNRGKTIKTYVDSLWGGFYVFDVCRVVETSNGPELEYIPYDVYKPLLDECGVPYIPLLSVPGVGNGIVNNPSVDDLMQYVMGNTWMIKPGKGIGEGVIIKNYNFRNRRGELLYAKIVASEMAKKREAERVGNRNKIQNLTSGKGAESSSIFGKYSKGVEARILNKYVGLQQLRDLGRVYTGYKLNLNDMSLMLMRDILCKSAVTIVAGVKQPIDFNMMLFLIRQVLTTSVESTELVKNALAENDDDLKKRLSRYDSSVEERMVDEYITLAYVDKEYHKFMSSKGEWERRFIPEFINHVYNEFLSEELFNALVYLQMPILDFSKMQRLISSKIKALKPDLYGGADKVREVTTRQVAMKQAAAQRRQAEADSLRILPLQQGEILNEDLQHYLQYYEGDLSWIMANRSLPYIAQNWAFWNDAKAYNSINSMFFPELTTELARSSEGKDLNPAIMTNIYLLKKVCNGVFNCMLRNPTPKNGYKTYRVDRLKDVRILQKYGCTMAFTSTSTAGFLREYCESKYDIVLLEFHIGPNIPCAYMEKLLGTYQKTNEAEITLPPFVRVKLHEREFSAEELTLRDQRGNLPIAKYAVELTWEPKDIPTAFPHLMNNPEGLNAYENLQIYNDTRELMVRLCSGLNQLKGTPNVPTDVQSLMRIGHFTEEDIRKIYAMKQSFRRGVLNDFNGLIARCGDRFKP